MLVWLQQKLGLLLEKEDEMDCLVEGCNFLLKAIRHEAFTYINNTTNFIAANGEWQGLARNGPPCSGSSPGL